MFKSRTFVALGLLVVVAVALWVSRGKKDRHARELGANAGAPAPVTAEAIDGLEIAEPGKAKIVLARDGDGWKLVEPVAGPADGKTVDAALQALAELRFIDVVADSKSSHESLEIREQDALAVTAKSGGKVALALLLGKKGHVRVTGSDAVWQVAKLPRQLFSKEVKMWRFREVLRLEADKVERLEVSFADGDKLVARREAGVAVEGQPPPPATWTLLEGADRLGGAFDPGVPASALTTLARVDVAEFADGVTAEAAGLVPPRVSLTAVLAGGERKTLELGAADGELVFARAGERIFKLRKGTADALGHPPRDWRDKTLAQVKPDEVKKIELERAGLAIAFAREGDSWKVVAGEVPEFDPARIAGYLSSFASLKAQSVADKPADRSVGFDRPQGKVRLSGDKGVLLELVVAASVPDVGTYVQRKGDKAVYLIGDGQARRLLKGGSDFKKQVAPAGMPPGMQMH